MIGSLARLVGASIVIIVLQITVISQVRLFGASPELPMVFAVALGLTLGADRGALLGFAVGLFHDVFLSTPLGLAALSYAVGAYVLGRAQPALAGADPIVAVVSLIAGSLLSLAVFASGALVFGQEQVLDLPVLRLAAVEAGAVAVTGVAVLRLAEWATRAWMAGP